jgi:hypothetical protein
MTQAPKPILYVDVMLVIKLRFTGLVDSNEWHGSSRTQRTVIITTRNKWMICCNV